MDNVIWFGLPANNLTKASKFYNEAFGWKITPQTKDSVIAKTTGASKKGIDGTISKRVGGSESPTIIIKTKNIDVALKKVTKLGGRVIAPKKPNAKGNGWYAFFEDTEKNLIELWQAR